MMNENLTFNKKWIFSTAGAIVFAWILLFAFSSSATSTSDKVKDAKESVEQSQQRLEDSKEHVEEMEDAKNQLEGKMAELNKELATISAQLEASQDELSKTQQAIEETRVELEKAEAVEEVQYENMKKRIQFMYENGTTDMIYTIFSGGDFTDMLNKAEFFTKMTEYDRSMLAEYTRVKDVIANSKTVLEQEEKDMRAAMKEVESRQSQVNHLVNETADEIAKQMEDLEEAEARALEYEKQLEEEQNTLEALKAKEEEERRILEAQKALLEKKRREEEARKQAQQSGQNTGSNEEGTGNGNNGDNAGTDKDYSNTVTLDSNNKVVGQGSDKNLQTNKDGYAQAAATSDLKLLATIIYCEAGNQPYEGKIAVGSVVMNRINSPLFPATMLSVLYQKTQFTPVMSGRFAVVLAKDGATQECYAAAQEVLNGRNNVPDCLFFRTVIPGKEGTIIGDHVFY